MFEKDNLIDALENIQIIKDVLNGDDVNRLNEITNLASFFAFDIAIDGKNVNLGIYLANKNLVNLFIEDPKLFKTIITLEPVIKHFLNRFR